MRLITILLLVLSTTLVYAQKKGELYLRVFPKDAIIRLNDSTLLDATKKYSLDTGAYTLKMWLPKREYVERTVVIREGKSTQLLEVLSYSESYQDFRKKKRWYATKKLAARYGSPIVLALFINNTLSVWRDLNNKVEKNLDAAIITKSNYNNAVIQNDVTSQETLYNERRDFYEKSVDTYNRSKRNGIITGTVMIAGTVFLEYLSFKMKKPEYKEKVMLANFTLYQDNNQLAPGLAFTYKF